MSINSFTFKIGYVPSAACTLCNEPTETISHILCKCPYSVDIWKKLHEWIGNHAEGTINFSEEHILFGFKGKHNNSLNVIVMITKCLIYKFNRKIIKPHFPVFQKEIKKYYETSKFISYSNCNYANFYAFWSSFHLLFKNSLQ